MAEPNTTWDYIIIGAGSSGCVLANRLTENPQTRVLLLEAGPTDSNFWIHIPVGFNKLLNNTRYNWCFATEPEDNVRGRSIPIPRGKCLGGSSSINGMLYVRGNPLDYNTWAQLGNRGWSYDSVLPYFRKSEHFEGAHPIAEKRGSRRDRASSRESDAQNNNSDETRGRNGPLNVAPMCENHEICDAFIAAGVAEGWPRNPDYNNGEQEGFGYYQVTQKRGRRWSTARAFLRPALTRPNLRVETGAHVTAIMLEGRRAVGVRYMLGNQPQEARCGAEVILAAGAVKSPHILELSGIGQPDLLQSLGIQVRHALPGVGENYRDHFAPRMNWRVTLPITLNEQTRGLNFAREIAKYFVLHRGILTFTAGIAYGFIRTRPELEEPDVQYHFAHASYATAATRILDSEPGMTITTYQCRPESKGSIHARSADPMANPAIRPNFLADELDRRTVIAGMKIARRIINNPAMDRYRGRELNPGEAVQTDDEWLEFARINGQTTYHVCGTCKMGSDPMAVVDDQLRVRGIDGLRVIDASIFPTMISGNTNAAVIMTAERGADLVKQAARGEAPALAA